MGLSNNVIESLSNELMEAQETRVPVVSLAQRYPEMDLSDAYRIQLRTLDRRVAAGAMVIGAKVGFTSLATQQQFGVSEPVAGLLLNSTVYRERADIPTSLFVSPRIEPEIAFVLGEDLEGPGVTVARALQATAGLMPAIELVDLRIQGRSATALDVTADSAGGWGLVLGGGLTPVHRVDPRVVGVALSRNGEVIATGTGAAALGNPAEVLAWLANRLATLGLSLKRGHVVITGSLVRAEPVTPGDTFSATFSCLGSVSARFA